MKNLRHHLLESKKKMEDDGKDEEIEDLDVEIESEDEESEDEESEDEELDESGKFIRTTKMKNSAKLIKQTTDELFGKNGSNKLLVSKVFKIFKKTLKKNAKQMNVPLGDAKSWILTLRDYSSSDLGKTTSGKKIQK